MNQMVGCNWCYAKYISREAELGTGKWDAQGRDVHKLFEAIPDSPFEKSI